MKKLGCYAVVSILGLVGCGQQEPAATPLAAPPPAETATLAPAPTAEAKKEEPKPAPPTPEQEAKLYEATWAAFNSKDFAKFQSMWAEGATSEGVDMGPPVDGAAAILEQRIKPFTTAFPDATGEIQLTLVNGNTVIGVVLMRGTQTGPSSSPMGSGPATNKKVGFLAAQKVEFNDAGKIARESMIVDDGTIAGQLGHMPMPHRNVMMTGWAEKPVVLTTGSDVEKANVVTYNTELSAMNKGDAAGALGAAADDLVFSELSAPADRVGKKNAVKGVQEMFKAFPDTKVSVTSVWGAGDYVVATGNWSGTNTGDMPGMKMKKTGKAVSLHFIEIDKFAGGKAKNIWVFSNGAAAAAQLGMMPPPHGEAKPAQYNKPAKPEAKMSPPSKPDTAGKPGAPMMSNKPAPMKPMQPTTPPAQPMK